MSALITPIEALAELLTANFALAEEQIDQAEYDDANQTFIATVGDEAADRLTEISVTERWSPSDMQAAADDPTWLQAILVQIGVA